MWSVSQAQEKNVYLLLCDTMTHQQTQTDQANKEIREFEIILKHAEAHPSKHFLLIWSESHEIVLNWVLS